uniref:Uncharacterized protein n=1 Tax=Oryzias sinensis TaxID=183150 RepID=A0A8C7WV20_9TELE
MPCTPLTPSSSLAPLGSQFQTGDLAWLSAPPGPCSPGTASTDAIALGLSGSGVRLECFRFSTPGQEIQETPSNDSSPLGEQILGALEVPLSYINCLPHKTVIVSIKSDADICKD